MKRLFVDDSEIAVLSDRIFSKRLRIDDSHISSTLGQKIRNDNPLDVESVILVNVSTAYPLPSLNPTFAELHQEREERKKLKTLKSSNQQIECHPEPAKYVGPRSAGIPWHEAYLTLSKFQGNPLNHFRKQMQCMSDYYSRCEVEQRNDCIFENKLSAEVSDQKLLPSAQLQDRFSSNAESFGRWEHHLDKGTIKHHTLYYMNESVSASYDDQDQMEVD